MSSPYLSRLHADLFERGRKNYQRMVSIGQARLCFGSWCYLLYAAFNSKDLVYDGGSCFLFLQNADNIWIVLF